MPETQAVKDSEILTTIDALCNRVGQKSPKHGIAAGKLRDKCKQLYEDLEQYEKIDATGSTALEYRTTVIECLKDVKDTIEKWSKRIWLNRSVNQDTSLRSEFNDCNTKISGCIDSLATARMEAEWNEDNLGTGDDATVEEYAAVDFIQRVKESKLALDDIKAVSMTIQKGLAEYKAISEEQRKTMAQNLYRLLGLYNQLPPICQLDSGEVQQSIAIVLIGHEKRNLYKGIFLESEDVRIKAIRCVNPDNETTKMEIKREVGLWAKAYEIDQRKLLIPFYGFYLHDTLGLALVSPWMNNGDALAYVKERDNTINYKALIIDIAEGLKFLHSNNPPIVHGSLKAANVLIGDLGKPRISDFAHYKLQGSATTWLKFGDYRWRAPEILRFEVICSASGDVYSLGMTILELLTHKRPYANLKSTFRVLSRKLKGDGMPERLVDERVVERGLDARMWQFLCQCWSNDPGERPSMSNGFVNEIIYDPRYSEKERSVDTPVKTFVAEDSLADVPVKKNKMTKYGLKEEPPLPSLLQLLVSEQSGSSLSVNQVKLNLVHKLLGLPDLRNTCSKMSNLDAELLLDFILSLISNSSLENSGIKHADRKALRKLMFKMISAKDDMVLPKSLFIADVAIGDGFGKGGFGRVFKGQYKGKQVAVKVVDKVPTSRSGNGFCMEALVWRSLAHRFILPLLGIYEEKAFQYLVSPLMENGTLVEWRGKSSDVPEIHRLMLEVAEGMQYLHSERIVHGDLHGRNVLLDSEFHCKITDFGLTRHSEATVMASTEAWAASFAAPELLGSCPKCGQSDCSDCGQPTRTKTLETDVYAFGCLYYAWVQ